MRHWLVVLVISCVAYEARAEDAASQAPDLPSDERLQTLLSSPTMTAPRAYARGVQLFDADRLQAAEQAWARSHALEPNPVLLIAIARVREELGDEPGTVAILERYLVERPDAPDRAAVEARIATLLETPATVIVRSDEEGHAILIDGKPVDDKTPARIELEPGVHTLVVVGDGVQVGEQTVQLGYGENRELVFTASIPSEVVVEERDPAGQPTGPATPAKRAVWILTGISAASLVTGTVLGVTALREERSFRNDPTTATADRGERLALFSDLSFGISALTAVTALTVFLTTRNAKKRGERADARFRFEARGPGAAATLRF